MRLKVVLLVLKLKDLKIYDIFHAKLNAVESLQTLAQDLFHNCKKTSHDFSNDWRADGKSRLTMAIAIYENALLNLSI